tara:strand:- start:242 stop:655 length:414 start_codon:yes stop_codon:yes gene_type:complete
MSDITKLTYLNDREKSIAGTIEVPLKVYNYHLDCILSGAFEGGSNYWADLVEVVDNDYKGAEFASEVISRGGELLIYTQDSSGGGIKLTKEKMLKGCKLYVSGTETTKGRNFDIDAWDAIDHDMILQYALFEEVVYG